MPDGQRPTVVVSSATRSQVIGGYLRGCGSADRMRSATCHGKLVAKTYGASSKGGSHGGGAPRPASSPPQSFPDARRRISTEASVSRICRAARASTSDNRGLSRLGGASGYSETDEAALGFGLSCAPATSPRCFSEGAPFYHTTDHEEEISPQAYLCWGPRCGQPRGSELAGVVQKLLRLSP